MSDQLVAVLKDLNANPEVWSQMALCYRNAHDALVAAGFTPEQAYGIVKQNGAISAPSS